MIKAKNDLVSFAGLDSGNHVNQNFTTRIALPYVMYDNFDQNRTPLETLTGAILSHAQFLNEKNNGFAILENLYNLKIQAQQPQYNNGLVFKFIEAENFDDILLQCMKILTESSSEKLSKQEHNQKVTDILTEKRIYANYSPEEIALKQQEKNAKLLENFKNSNMNYSDMNPEQQVWQLLKISNKKHKLKI